MKKLLLLSVLGLAACSESRGVHGDWSKGAHFAPNSAPEYHARAQRGEPGVFPAPSGYSVYTERQRIASGAARSDGVIRQGTASSRTGLYSETEAVVVSSAAEAVTVRKVGNTTVKTYTYGTPPRKATVETTYRGKVSDAQIDALPEWALPAGTTKADLRRVANQDPRIPQYRKNALQAARRVGSKGQAVSIGGQSLLVARSNVSGLDYVVVQSKGSFLYTGTLDLKSKATVGAAIPQLTGCSSFAAPFVAGLYHRPTHFVYPVTCG